MQLINSPKTTLNTEEYKRLFNALDNITQKVEIRADFSIHHPDYKPLELPTDVVARFQKLPKTMRDKYLSLQLRGFLYSIYYNGSIKSELIIDNQEDNLILDLENKTFLGIDLGFYERLHNNNFGKGYFNPGWYILKEEGDGSLIVTNENLRLHIQRDKHLKANEANPAIGDIVSIRMPKNLLQNGFYMAVGNVDSSNYQDTNSQRVTVRIYFNFTSEGAVTVMASLTQRLNEMEIPFNYKVLYNPKNYQRYDSGVLYFDKRYYATIKQVVKIIYTEHKSYFKPEVPLFTKQLAPGLGLAEEPNQKFAEQESFGMNRCQIVANGLLEAWHQGDNSPEVRMKAILQQFDFLEIDLQHTYLNANSDNIYSRIDEDCW